MDSPHTIGSTLLSFDLTRAFDNVNHERLIEKLKEAGFPKSFLVWIMNYLRARTGRVKVGNKLSNPYEINIGVPQGSILAPFLFGVYISDFKALNKEDVVVKYADDVSMIIPMKNTFDSKENSINEEIMNMKTWCNENSMMISKNKSQIMLCKKKTEIQPNIETELSIVNSMKILGMTFSSDLDWSQHVSNICSTANKRMHILRTLKPLTNPEELHLIYTSTIRPALEYGCQCFIGLNRTLSNNLSRVDKRAHKIIKFGNHFS